jgi:hypothetical protein
VETERLTERGHPARLEIEHGHHVEAIAEILDRIRDPALAPALGGLDGAPVFGDPLVDPLDRGVQRIFVEIGANNGHNLIGAQFGTLLPLDCSGVS